MKPKAKGYYYNALMHTFNRLRVKNVHQEKERERKILIFAFENVISLASCVR